MSDAQHHFVEACDAVVAVLDRHDGSLDLSAPTPCREFDAAALVNHWAATTAAMARVGRREPLDPDDPWGADHDAADGDWAQELASNVAAVGAAWARDEAWDGVVQAGANEMPAASIGDMAFAEILLHGWDFACATGQDLSVPGSAAAELRRILDDTGEMGRQMGAYGEAVEATSSDDDFARALKASGRDPQWRAGGAD